MSTEFSKFAKLLREAEPETAVPAVTAETVEGGETETVEGGETATTEEKIDVNAWAEWVNTSITEDADKQEIWAALFTESYPSVWTTEEILEVVNELTPQQHVYVYANLVQGTSLTELINSLTKDAQERLFQLVQKFNLTGEVGTEAEEYVIEHSDIVDGHVQTIRSMDEFDEENEKTSAAVIAALLEKEYIKFIKEGLENAKRTKKGPWYLRPIPKGMVVSSLKKDKNKQIENTISAITDLEEIVTMLTRINAALIKAASEGSGKEAQDLFAQSQTIGASYTPEGEIIEEIFGWTNKVLDDDQFKKVIASIEKNPETDRTRDLVTLIVNAAMSHRTLGDEVYQRTKDLKALQIIISATKTGKRAVAKQAEDDHDAAVAAAAADGLKTRTAGADLPVRTTTPTGKGVPLNMSSYDPQDTKLGKLGTILREELANRNKSE